MRRFLSILLAVVAIPSAAAARDLQGPGAVVSGETPGYHFLVARRLENAGKIDEAIATLQRAIAALPTSAELRAELASLYARQDRVLDALNTAEEALTHDRGNVEANKIAGTIFAALAEQKRPARPGDDPAKYADRALAALEKARGAPGTDLSTELALGRLYLRSGRHDAAIAALSHLVEQQPQYSDGGMLLSAAQEAAGKIAEATATVEATLQHNPTFFRGYARLITLYEQQRRWKDAAAAYAVAQQLNPKADLARGRALALVNSGQLKEAEALLQQTLKKTSSPDAALLYLLAETQRKGKAYAAALATSEKLRAADPDRTVFVYQHAQILEDSGRRADAERELRALMARDPKDANAMNALGYMLAERGERLDEAVDLVRRALAVEPGNPSFLDSLGWAFFKQGRLELADPPLTEAAAKSPDNSVIQDHLGELRFRQQRFADAAVAWERALAGDGDSIDPAAIQKKLADARARVTRR